MLWWSASATVALVVTAVSATSAAAEADAAARSAADAAVRAGTDAAGAASDAAAGPAGGPASGAPLRAFFTGRPAHGGARAMPPPRRAGARCRRTPRRGSDTAKGGVMKCYANHWGVRFVKDGRATGRDRGPDACLDTKADAAPPLLSAFSAQSGTASTGAPRQGRAALGLSREAVSFGGGGGGGRWASERSLEPLSHLGSQVQGP